MNAHDRWLYAPYEEEAMHLDEREKLAETISQAMKPEEHWNQWLAQAAEDQTPQEIIDAIRQRDFEALGGLVYRELDRFLWECAVASADFELRR